MSLRSICLLLFVGILSLGLAFGLTSHLTDIIAGVAGLAWCVLSVLGQG